MKKMNKNRGFTLIEILAVIVILGLLLAITIPSVSKYILRSRKQTVVETINSYISSLTIDVNDSDYYFLDVNTVYAVPIECIEVSKGGTDPFGTWFPAGENQWAYVLIQYDQDTHDHIYGFAFKDSSGYGLYPIVQQKLDEKGEDIISDIVISKPVTGDINSITTFDKWEGFKVSNSTDLVVLSALPKGEEGNGETTCTLKQEAAIPEIIGPESPEVDPSKPNCSLEIIGTKGQNGWYSETAPIVQFANVGDILSNSEIVEYGMGNTSTYNFNSLTTYIPSDGVTTVYGYLKNNDGKIGVCSIEVKYDASVDEGTLAYGYQIYPKGDLATVDGQKIKFNSNFNDYGNILGVNVYLKNNSSGMVLKISDNTKEIITRTISAGVLEMNMTFNGSYDYLEMDLGNVDNINLIDRIEVVTNHTDGIYTNQDVNVYVNSSDGVYYSFNTESYQTSNKFTYTANGNNYSVKIKDSAGNVSEMVEIVIDNIDRDKPSCLANDGNQEWKTSKVINQYCDDSFSGCRKAKYSIAYPSATVKNKKTDSIEIYDKAGNSNTCLVDVYVDSTPPSSCTVNMTNSNGVVNSGDVSTLDIYFDASGVDNNLDDSGIANVKWTVVGDGKTFNNLTSTSGLANDDYSVSATCTDNAGNATTSDVKTFILGQVITITFDSNGGSGTMNTQQCYANVDCVLTNNLFANTGSTFTGWSTSSGGYAIYNNGGKVNLSSDTTLYAVWQFKGSLPSVYCDNSKYSWSNVSSSVDISVNDDDGDFKTLFYRRYGLGENFASTTSAKYTFTGAYYRVQVQASDNAGNTTSATSCYTKFDNIPRYAPYVVEARPGKGDAVANNVKTITFECDNDDVTSTVDRICHSYITRYDTSRTVYDSYSFNSSQGAATSESGVSPERALHVYYYYRNGSAPCEDHRYVVNGAYQTSTCEVKGVDYRIIVFEDEARNLSPKLYIYSTFID